MTDIKSGHRTLLAGFVLGMLCLAAPLRVEHVAPALFEIEPNVRYAGTDLNRWEVFTRRGVQLSPKIAIEFVGTNPRMKLEGVSPAGATLGIYQSNDSTKWKPVTPSFEAIAYRGLYPGIDLVYRRKEGRLKGDFIVQPGVDPSQIRFRFTGATVRALGRRIEIRSEKETLEERLPLVYDEAADRNWIERAAAYRQHPDGSIGFHVVGHDPALQLVIDPDLTFSTYLAGSMLDQVTATAYGPDGTLLVAGWTESPNFMGTSSVQAGSVDGFFGRFAISGSGTITLSSMVLFGGSGTDKATSIGVNAAGAVVIGGSTASFNFPVTTGAYQSKLRGTSDGFILKFQPQSSAVSYATYFGGSSADQIYGIAVDSSDVVYFAGNTSSTNLSLLNAAQGTYGGGQSDGFAAALNPNQTLVYSTYIGGAYTDTIAGLAMLNHEVYLTGGTDSVNFPLLNAFQSTPGGGQDAFVVKLTSSGARSYSTYLGGSNGTTGYPEMGTAIAVNAAGEAYVAGVTSSNAFQFQSPPPVRAFGGGAVDGFIAKFSTGGAVAYWTYWGGAGWDQVNAITVLSNGLIAVTGQTNSLDLPTQLAVQKNWGSYPGLTGNYDGFVAIFWSTLGNAWSTYLGGDGTDAGYAIAANPAGEVFVGGLTGAINFPLVSALQTSISSNGYHGFLSRISPSKTTDGVYRGSSGNWYLGTNHTWSTSTTIRFGDPGDLAVVGDWDNTGVVRLGAYRHGLWYLDYTGATVWPPAVYAPTYAFGPSSSLPVVGDWDNTGKVRIGVFLNGTWYLDMNSNGSWDASIDRTVFFGQAGDVPIVGDWTNSGKTRIGVFRNGTFILDINGDFNYSNATTIAFYSGSSGDLPMFADWDRTGVKHFGVYSAGGQWLIDSNGDGVFTFGVDRVLIWGGVGDTPINGVHP